MTGSAFHGDEEKELDPGAPLSTALVIGLGGSGIQVLSRLQPAVRDRSRPEAVVHDNIVFLGIDSVDLNQQYPALPPGAGLDKDEFFNVVPQPINAMRLWKDRWSSDPYLRQWGDASYAPPNEPLVSGLKRSRMLGRLAFQEVLRSLEAKLSERIRQCVELGGDTPGVRGVGGRLRVYVVTSTVGGTGSSGFLHVLRALHAAARTLQISVEVWPVLFPASVFRSLWSEYPELRMPHEANTYAFFRELDHFATVPGAFDSYLTIPGAHELDIQPGALIDGVMVVDSTLSDGKSIAQLDTFELASSNLYDVLMAGQQKISTVLDTNVSMLRQSKDALGYRRCYVSIGVGRVVFPGTSYRRFLRARTEAELVRLMLGADEDLVERDAESQLVSGLFTKLDGLLSGLGDVVSNDDTARRALGLANNMKDAIDVADGEGRPAVAQDYVSRLRAMSNHLETSLGDALNSKMPSLKKQVDQAIDETLAGSGEPVSVMIYALEKLVGQDRLETLVKKADGRFNTARGGARRSLEYNDEGSLTALLREYEGVHRRSLIAKLASRKQEDRALSALAAQVDQTARWARDKPAEEARKTLAQYMLDRAKEALNGLKEARKELRQIGDELEDVWERDDYSGKDQGPAGLSWYVPDDVPPGADKGIDTSAFAKYLWGQVAEDISGNVEWKLSNNGSMKLRSIFEEWLRADEYDSVTRGVIGLGMGSQSLLAANSRTRLRRVLRDSTEELARPAKRFPEDIFEAADWIDAGQAGDHQGRALDAAIRNLDTLSKTVAISLDPARIRNQSGDTVPPRIIVQLATSASNQAKLPQFADATFIETNDGETIDVGTYQMGFPFHAIAGAADWKHSYDLLQASRRRHGLDSEYPPPHVDQRFEDDLRKLTPRMFFDKEIAEIVAHAGAVQVLKQTHSAGYQALGLGERFPLVRERRQVGASMQRIYVGTEFTYDVDSGAVYGTRNDYGSRYRELFDGLAKAPRVQQGLADLKRSVERRYSEPDFRIGLVAAIDKYEDNLAASAIPRVEADSSLSAEDRQVEVDLISLIIEVLRRLRGELGTFAKEFEYDGL